MLNVLALEYWMTQSHCLTQEDDGGINSVSMVILCFLNLCRILSFGKVISNQRTRNPIDTVQIVISQARVGWTV